MYETFYKFSGTPFALTPDSRMFFGGQAHRRAIAHLNFGLSQGEGFVVITGEVGAGKTTLSEWLWSQLDRGRYTVARVNTTQVSEDDLFRLAMGGFGLGDPEAGKAALLRQFEDKLRAHQEAGRHCLLVVDEVQRLSVAALEELRMLSNITHEGRSALQTILLGQPQFRQILASPALDQLRQRVLASYHLGPLGREETRAYVEHRLKAVGWEGNPHWTEDAFAAVFRHTGGIPRRVNRLCARALLYGALEESREITGAMVDRTADELQHDLEGAIQDWAPASGDASGDGPAGAMADAGIVAAGPPLGADALLRRVEVLEARVARRERAFERLADMLATAADPR